MFVIYIFNIHWNFNPGLINYIISYLYMYAELYYFTQYFDQSKDFDRNEKTDVKTVLFNIVFISFIYFNMFNNNYKIVKQLNIIQCINII